MSEMIKNSDVEDVLFSIRRLVSDTPEARPEQTPEVDSVSETTPKAGALILTSALRVNDPATEPEQIDLEDMGRDLSHFRDAVSRDGSETDSYTSLEEVFADQAESEQPRRLHLSEVVSDTVPAAPSSIEEEYFEDEDTGDLSVRKWSENPDVETLGDFATPEDTFGTPEAEDSAEIEPETAEAWAEDAAADVAEGQGLDTEFDVEEEAQPEEQAQVVEDTSGALGGPEADVADQEVAEPDADEPEVADGLADFDENILDEDALRDMVTEIVREELSGELGERITRNVRKLVRREIHRALMTREVD